MAISLVTNSGVGNPPDGIDTTGGADLIILAVSYASWGGQPTVVDSASNVWTPLTEQVYTANSKIRIYYCAAPSTSGSHTFWTTGANFSRVGAAVFSGTAASPFDAESGVSYAASGSNVGAITPSVDGALLFVAADIADVGKYFTIDSGFTELFDVASVDATSYGVMGAYLIQGTASSVNPALTTTDSVHFCAAMAAFKPAAGGGGATSLAMRRAFPRPVLMF